MITRTAFNCLFVQSNTADTTQCIHYKDIQLLSWSTEITDSLTAVLSDNMSILLTKWQVINGWKQSSMCHSTTKRNTYSRGMQRIMQLFRDSRQSSLALWVPKFQAEYFWKFILIFPEICKEFFTSYVLIITIHIYLFFHVHLLNAFFQHKHCTALASDV